MLAGWVRDIAEIIPGALHGGGSAGDAQHFAGEMLSRHYYDRAPCVTTDSSVLTAIGNDYGYDRVFEGQILGLGCPGYRLIAISSSGGRGTSCGNRRRPHAPSNSTPLIRRRWALAISP